MIQLPSRQAGQTSGKGDRSWHFFTNALMR